MFLDDLTFKTVIDSSPLVSIDLLIENSQGQFLLGQRTNRPAQGFWFVPGGRIRKDETLAAAFARITLEELGIELAITDAELQGPYDHFYTDSIFGESVSTHYVAIAYHMKLTAATEEQIELQQLPVAQHHLYQWLSPEALLGLPSAHKHTKAYFG
jgi:colanic acid biosynthesis protein WcaH